jgi:hypothetical protein
MLDVIDDQDINGAGGGLQLEPELLLKCRKLLVSTVRPVRRRFQRFLILKRPQALVVKANGFSPSRLAAPSNKDPESVRDQECPECVVILLAASDQAHSVTYRQQCLQTSKS